MSTELTGMERYAAAMPGSIHGAAVDHLLRHQRMGALQEDLCFGLWRPSVGNQRATALIHELVLPLPDEVQLQGNVSFTARYLERASERADRCGSGLVLMHSHFGPGWQAMSEDDVAAERGRAAFVLATTGHPLLGLTLGTDESWSARFWPRVAEHRYSRMWCESVRVVGKKLNVTYHPTLKPVPPLRAEQTRTVSAWGPINQASLARLHVGVVGVGSVGRIIVEALARMGIQRTTVIDFDRLGPVNLDRQIGAYSDDVGRLKVDLAREAFERAATAADPLACAVAAAVTEPEGYSAALDCDVIFCCVDRPWGRRVLNHLAYAHLIPVVDGGILVRTTQSGTFRGAEWSCRTAGPERCCLACAGAYDPALVDDERRGLLDDPAYLTSIPREIRQQASQNVIPFSLGLAAQQLLQFCALGTGLLEMPDLGDQRFHYNLREIEARDLACDVGCEFPALLATGETAYSASALTGPHPAAEAIRRSQPSAVSDS